VKLSEEIDEAYKKLRKAEIILSVGYEDKELQGLSVEIGEAREILTNLSLKIVERAIQTEDQQKKWLEAIQIVDETLSDLEDRLTEEEFEVILTLRKRLSDTFSN
jgi:hypothetical protein